MADIAIDPFDGTLDSGNIQNPVRGELGADLKTSGVQIDDDDTMVLDCEFNDDVLLFILDTGGGSTFNLLAGDYPPSPQAEKGTRAYPIPADDLLMLVPEAGRHVHDDGKIRATVAAGHQVLVWAFRMPAGFVGIGQMNRTTIPAAPA